MYTFGVFIRSADDPANDGFRELNDPILNAVDQAEGLIARSGYAADPGPDSWGNEVYPEFYKEEGDGWSPATLSLWTDLESSFAFTYFGIHKRALSRGGEWFRKPEWPPFVLWWHEAPEYPLWSDGVLRHKHLHENGPSPFAFTFKVSFDQHGKPVKLDKARLDKLRHRMSNG